MLEVTGHDRLLAEPPGAVPRRRSCATRTWTRCRYLQLRALTALRAASVPEDARAAVTLLLLTVNGVAAGLQNTG